MWLLQRRPLAPRIKAFRIIFVFVTWVGMIATVNRLMVVSLKIQGAVLALKIVLGKNAAQTVAVVSVAPAPPTRCATRPDIVRANRIVIIITPGVIFAARPPAVLARRGIPVRIMYV